MKERMEDLREASGEVSYSDPLTTFFYLLMRNELAAGKVEALVREAVDSAEDCLFTNGWLAHYANNLAEEVKNARVIHLQKALDQAFTDTEEKKKVKAKQEERERIKTELKNAVGDSLDDEELAKLEKQLIQAAETGKITSVDKDVDIRTSAEGAKDAVQQLVSQGHITQEQADALASDIDDVTDVKPDVVPEVEEVVKENKEEDMVTAEEAKEIVEHAVELSETVEELEKEKLLPEAANKLIRSQMFKKTKTDLKRHAKPTGLGEFKEHELEALREGGFEITKQELKDTEEVVKTLKNEELFKRSDGLVKEDDHDESAADFVVRKVNKYSEKSDVLKVVKNGEVKNVVMELDSKIVFPDKEKVGEVKNVVMELDSKIVFPDKEKVGDDIDKWKNTNEELQKQEE
ncbi:hypothetical protein LCGC14_1474370 [marine sediment metagenome]|uniref:Uncharacterized protein n=1 Tax=marine sediment metagenome TaxID=412755 RepID=A0A0F9JBD4_9ZZZZ